jgi:capsular polysaccharide biosynthesis protein
MFSPRFINRFSELFFRHFWLNILPVIAMCLAAVLFLVEPIYVSHASIYVQDSTLLDKLIQIRIRDQPFEGVAVLTPAQIAANEFKELIQTDAFVFAVVAESNLRDKLNGSPDEVREVLKLYRESFSVAGEGDSLVTFQVKADQPELAYQLATATLNSYRSWKISKDVQDGQIAQSFFEEILVPYKEDVDRAQEAMRDFVAQYPEPAVGARPAEEEVELKRLQSEIDRAEERYRNVLDKAESARLALAQSQRDVDQVYKVVDKPVVPPTAEPLFQQALFALVFPVVGLLLTVVIVLGRSAADRTLLNRLDVAAEFELPVLAHVAAITPHHKRKGRQQQASSTPRSEESVTGSAHA